MARPKGKPHTIVTIRIQTELYDRLVASAAENERSLTREISFRLRQSFPETEPEPEIFDD
jgi:hypothetical protein